MPPIYKALSATFRNRLRFAFVNMEASVALAEIVAAALAASKIQELTGRDSPTVIT